MPRIAVDLFCGSGGFTAGLKAAGWSVAAAVDNDPIASATYQKNHPEVAFIEEDITANKIAARMSEAVEGRSVDLLVICAPCQPFSSQNRKRGNDPREHLIIKSLALVKVIQPSLIFFENVPGLAGPSHRTILSELRLTLSKLGYEMTNPLVKNAADFGVPQRRKRCIMLAARQQSSLDSFLKADVSCPKRTVQDAIGDLLPLGNGESYTKDKLHRARSHSEIALKRLANIPKNGGSRRSLPSELELRCHSGSKAFPDVYGRMRWDDVAPTLTTGCTDVTRGRFAHPDQDRAITLREAARLQTFEDDYKFEGNSSQVACQIGNAVPPAMVTAFAPAFEAALNPPL